MDCNRKKSSSTANESEKNEAGANSSIAHSQTSISHLDATPHITSSLPIAKKLHPMPNLFQSRLKENDLGSEKKREAAPEHAWRKKNKMARSPYVGVQTVQSSIKQPQSITVATSEQTQIYIAQAQWLINSSWW